MSRPSFIFRLCRLVSLIRLPRFPLSCLMVDTWPIVLCIMGYFPLFCVGTLRYLTPPPLYYLKRWDNCPGSAVKSPVSYFCISPLQFYRFTLLIRVASKL